jgi:hypothetical protein
MDLQAVQQLVTTTVAEVGIEVELRCLVSVGATWSGMLGNFAAGAFMPILRPFRVGDFVEVGGIAGTVHEPGLFGTTIVTPDNVMTLVGRAAREAGWPAPTPSQIIRQS